MSGQRVTLAYYDELQAIPGFEVLPLGVIRQRLDAYMQVHPEPFDYQAFARELGVDGVIIGSITDYEAYYPPRMTLAVHWYAANPGFHPILPGYGLPWGTEGEKEIPQWVHYEAQRSLAAAQLESQTPELPADVSPTLVQHASAATPLMPEDRLALDPHTYDIPSESQAETSLLSEDGKWLMQAQRLPPNWPDARGFLPDEPAAEPPQSIPQSEPIISHMRNYNGSDEDFTEQLEDFFYFRDDARFGGWQAYLQRSEDFIRFCCHLHITETLVARGGQDKSRLILRWPIDRYTR